MPNPDLSGPTSDPPKPFGASLWPGGGQRIPQEAPDKTGSAQSTGAVSDSFVRMLLEGASRFAAANRQWLGFALAPASQGAGSWFPRLDRPARPSRGQPGEANHHTFVAKIRESRCVL